MKKTLYFILAPLLLCLSLQAAAGQDIYKYVDKEGNITFTNRRVPNAQKVSLASYSNPSPSRAVGAASTRAPDTVPKERNRMRRSILEQELQIEEQLFTTTQNSLQLATNKPDVENHQAQVVQLRNKLFQHQRNIAALKKELARF